MKKIVISTIVFITCTMASISIKQNTSSSKNLLFENIEAVAANNESKDENYDSYQGCIDTVKYDIKVDIISS